MDKKEACLQLEYAKMMLKDYEEEGDPELDKEAIQHYRDMIVECEELILDIDMKGLLDGKEKAKEKS